MTWLLWLAACAGCLAIGHILGAGWPDLQVRYVLAQEEIKRMKNERDGCPHCSQNAIPEESS